MTDDLIPVKYVRNADDRATGSVKFHDDDRPDLLIGETGEVTEAELHASAAYGAVLEPLSGDELKAFNAERDAQTSVQPKTLADMNREELEKVASDEGVDISGLNTKSKIADAIEAARSAQPEGVDSLPATATSSVGTVAPTGGGSSTAGPGGSPPSGPAGGGPGAAATT